jgi:peptidoglycan/xylan/chitin deacetylase (PgdA/CDA1 family)
VRSSSRLPPFKKSSIISLTAYHSRWQQLSIAAGAGLTRNICDTAKGFDKPAPAPTANHASGHDLSLQRKDRGILSQRSGFRSAFFVIFRFPHFQKANLSEKICLGKQKLPPSTVARGVRKQYMTDRELFGRQQRTLIALVAVFGLFDICSRLPWLQAFAQGIPSPASEANWQKLAAPLLAGVKSVSEPKQEASLTGTANALSPKVAPPPIFSAPQRFQGQVVNQAKLSGEEKVIALTFDDGPWEQTPEVLGILKEMDVKATFFWIGKNVQTYPEMAKQVVAAGHAIGNHTWDHPTYYMDRATAAKQIDSTNDYIFETTGVKTSLFRPPAGLLDNGLADYARNSQDVVLLWSVDTRDWQASTSVQMLVNTVLNDAKPGSIVLMHDGGGNRWRTVQALPAIIGGLKQLGYRFVTVPELLEMREKEIITAEAKAAQAAAAESQPALPPQ